MPPGLAALRKHPAGKPPTAGDKPLTKEQQEAAAILQKYLSVQQLQRTPGQALRAKADLCAPKKPAAKPDKAAAADDSAKVQEFYGQVTTGDWKAIKRHLAKLPKDVGPQVYTYLLVLMAKGKAYVLPDEILALADASPRDLDEPQLAALGQLLAQAREKLGLPKTMLAHIEQGTERLGGEDPKKRLTAARLLAGAGMTDQALLYLPPMDEVRRAKDPVLLNLYASCLQTLAERTPGGGGIRQAWELTQMVLERPQLTDEAKAEAVRRTVALVPLMPEKTVAGWVKRRFHERPELGMSLLAEAAQRVETTFPEKAPEPRLMALAAQHRLVESLLAAGGKNDPRWVEAIGLMTLGWINEAAYTLGGNGPVAADAASLGAVSEEDLSDPAVRERIMAAMRNGGGGNEIPACPPADSCPSRPATPGARSSVPTWPGRSAASAASWPRTSATGRGPSPPSAASSAAIRRWPRNWPNSSSPLGRAE